MPHRPDTDTKHSGAMRTVSSNTRFGCVVNHHHIPLPSHRQAPLPALLPGVHHSQNPTTWQANSVTAAIPSAVLTPPT